MDELGEITESESPYCYVGSNPVQRIDPDGRTWGDIIAGAVIGVATNILPGSTSYRESYTPTDASDYNSMLRAVDNSAAVAGGGAMILGADEMAAGGSIAFAGAAVSATGIGAVAGGPAMAAGGVIALKGALTVGAGAMLMNNANTNQKAGYDYGNNKESSSSSAKPNNAKPSLTNTKAAVKEAQGKVGGSLPKGKDGKFGSPQRGDSKKGYRLDPGHPGKPQGHPESGSHVNWWDYSKGKRDGTNSGAIPIKD